MKESIRRVAPQRPPSFLDIQPPQRAFVLDYAAGNYPGARSIQRLFLQAMDYGGRGAVVEEMAETGVIAEENAYLRDRYHRRYQMPRLHRISFWKRPLASERQLADADSRDFVGYAILKEDQIATAKTVPVGTRHRWWHVFESVLCPGPAPHHYVPGARDYQVKIGGGRARKVRGVLYGEQNRLNKSCAQVALRSLISLHSRNELSFNRINALAKQHHHSEKKFNPQKGLSSPQMEGVLKDLGISCQPLNYNDVRKQRNYARLRHYQRFLYAGLESGWGALLGFRRSAGHKAGHVVPVFGHTFNPHSWVPHSGGNPLRNDKGRSRYLTSDSWLSSFIMHDDMHGANFCMPRFYLKSEQVDYVAALLPPQARFGGTEAEMLAADSLDYLQRYFPKSNKNPWLGKLVECQRNCRLVLRATVMTTQRYVEHLAALHDWSGARERPGVVGFLAHLFSPETQVWVVEFMLPDLFPYGGQKLGEIVMDAEKDFDWEEGETYAPLLFGRFPGIFLFYVAEQDQRPSIEQVRSQLELPTQVHSWQ